jgi:hypothetical protein
MCQFSTPLLPPTCEAIRNSLPSDGGPGRILEVHQQPNHFEYLGGIPPALSTGWQTNSGSSYSPSYDLPPGDLQLTHRDAMAGRH